MPLSAERLVWLGSALAFVVAMAATPGPNNAMLTASGALWGLRRTMPHIIGVAAGFPVMVLAVGLGAGEVLRAHPWAQDVLRWVGVFYILFLAAKIARADPMPANSETANTVGQPLTVVQAALFQWVNPKAWVTAVGAVVTYTSGEMHILGETVALATLFLVVGLPVTVFWTAIGVGAARLLRSRRALRRFNVIMAALLVASLVPLLLED